MVSFPQTSHGRLAEGDWFGTAQACASCHGSAERHIEEADPEAIRNFPGADPAADNKLCLSCHTSASHMGAWPASEHALAGLSCVSCHTVHGRSGVHQRDAALGQRLDTVPESVCFECHSEVRAELRMPSHHPVLEGRMECASCHDVHGANPGLLKNPLRKNDLCLDCHTQYQGPFVFQHEPVEEDCSTCHRPHGAVSDNLLAQTEPFLCLQCHEAHFHASLASPEGDRVIAGTPRGNAYGEASMKHAFLTKCTQCHSQVHGSDLPSQSVTGQGEALTR